MSWNKLSKLFNDIHKNKQNIDQHNGAYLINKNIDMKSILKNKLKKILKHHFLSSYINSMPDKWYQANWFISRSHINNNDIKLTICKYHSFRYSLLNNGLKAKISWGRPNIYHKLNN